jgi:hypothetical protein
MNFNRKLTKTATKIGKFVSSKTEAAKSYLRRRIEFKAFGIPGSTFKALEKIRKNNPEDYNIIMHKVLKDLNASS